MSGNILREMTNERFNSKQDLHKIIENLVNMAPDHFNYKQMGTLIKVVKQMPFF